MNFTDLKKKCNSSYKTAVAHISLYRTQLPNSISELKYAVINTSVWHKNVHKVNIKFCIVICADFKVFTHRNLQSCTATDRTRFNFITDMWKFVTSLYFTVKWTVCVCVWVGMHTHQLDLHLLFAKHRKAHSIAGFISSWKLRLSEDEFLCQC